MLVSRRLKRQLQKGIGLDDNFTSLNAGQVRSILFLRL